MQCDVHAATRTYAHMICFDFKFMAACDLDWSFLNRGFTAPWFGSTPEFC